MSTSVDFIKQYPVHRFSKGEELLLPTSPTDNLYVIQSGFVKVYNIDTSGNERITWIAGRYDVAPSECLFSRAPKLQFMYAGLSKVTAYTVPRTDFLDYAHSEPDVMSEVARSMSAHYDDLLVRIHTVEQATIRDKLMQVLYHLAARFSAEPVVHLHKLGLNLTHQEIANLIGATRETVAIELKKLKDERFIHYTRSSLTIYTEKLGPLLI